MDYNTLLEGLQELSDTAFPRVCTNCGKEYPDLQTFIYETQQLEGRSGLMENVGCPDEGDEPIVELYRNCICGSTLMEFFSDRRDTSEAGLQRRQLFDNLLAQLVEMGVSTEEARNELKLFLSTGKSVLLEKMGIRTSF
ncbi:MAG: oxidoreductase [Candidatus Thiodiazotropha lotti]|nr:oxidoreductase [Candidatus Thiodiazotropha lotti]MCW4182838.1 oxidoreductase [Candidatus Thiodiazotropha weberae]